MVETFPEENILRDLYVAAGVEQGIADFQALVAGTEHVNGFTYLFVCTPTIRTGWP